ncbi:hypothetical protein [Flavobacterium sp. FlaQc-48]|uniref:hypothetical protein n=1 Tax=Flavobacterium sp. FlaQc-48 TaxID=3374181 RepID=UPI003756609C
MDFEKIEIELENNEKEIIEDIYNLRNKINDLDPEKLTGQLFASIKSKAIESVTISLGISDIMESQLHKNGLDLQKEFKDYQEWDKKPAYEKSKTYKPKNIHSDEFNKFLDQTKNLQYNRNELTGDAYKRAIKDSRTENPEGFICAYTGKEYKHGEKYDFEHVTSAHEISQDRVLHYITNVEERREFTNSKENIVVIGRELNQSLGKTKVEDKVQWVNKKSNKDSNKTNKEYHDVEENLLQETVNKSVEKLKEIKQNKKVDYSLKTKGKIVLGNTAKGAAKAAVGKLLTITIIEVINEYQKDGERDIKESAVNITNNIKSKAKDILDTFKNHSINSFVSGLVDALLNCLFKIAKNIFKFVKMAFNSILNAIKILFKSEMPMQDRINEALKILGVAVLGLVSIALEEIIEKALVGALPFTAPFAGFISSVLSGLIAGIGSILILQAFQKYQNNIEIKNLKASENASSSKLADIHLAKTGISNVKTTETIIQSIVIFENTMPLISSFTIFIEENLANIKNSNLIIANNIKEAKHTSNEINDLLATLD